jgi:transcriptional regulator with XRE-family HTH domain
MNLSAVPTNDDADRNDAERKRSVGEAMRRARESRRFSGAELAKRTGKRAGTLSDIENGKSLPDLSTLLAIADALEMSLDEVLGRAARPVPPTANRLGALEGDVALLHEQGEFHSRAVRAILSALAMSPILSAPHAERLSHLLEHLESRAEDD